MRADHVQEGPVRWRQRPRGALKAGITTEFLSIEEAAEHYGMPVDAVKEEIARYNTFVENKLDEDFKKPIPDDAQTIDEPPFYGVRLWPKVHHCMEE